MMDKQQKSVINSGKALSEIMKQPDEFASGCFNFFRSFRKAGFEIPEAIEMTKYFALIAIGIAGNAGDSDG